MQSDDLIQRLKQSEAFNALLRRKMRMCFMLSGIMTLVFFSYYIAIAWFPGWMGSPPFSGSSVSIGICFTVLAVLFSMGISAFYIWWAHNRYDTALQKLLQEHGHSEQ